LIPYSTQHITLLDRIRVFRALGEPFLTQGPAVEKFERAVAEYVGAEHAVAVNSATSALHIACLALGLGPGDIMWTSPISFVASANCGRYCGAEVDFVDIDPETFNMSPNELRTKLETAEKEGKLPKVIVVVHLAGEPADMEEISILAQKYGVKIIEDASHALGSSYQGHKVGSGAFSEITVFSFHAVKNMTTGEGGMAVTGDVKLAETMRALRSHGITRNPLKFETSEDQRTPWHYEQHSLGFNYRMTDFQAALGVSQLSTLDLRNRKRARVLEFYRENLSTSNFVSLQSLRPNNFSATHLAVVMVPEQARTKVASALKTQGFATNLHYLPIYKHPYYVSQNSLSLPNSDCFGRQAISLPCFSGITRRQVQKITDTLLGAL
jgi:UDP-4-amino-4,6-dideoxy-N-acetyl-beta-L-altrosamine transaminase